MRRLLRCARNDSTERPGQHHPEDGDQDPQMQKQIAARDQVVETKDERQNVIDDHQQNAKQGQ
jgi:hypothetical protein